MEKTPQEQIEELMQSLVGQGKYETAYLLSDEGLPLAYINEQQSMAEDRIIEMSLLFQETRKMADVMGNISEIKELIVEGNSRRKIIFRFFDVYDQAYVLALVIPPKTSYRGLTNKLVRLIMRNLK
ncbi:hypothetical protein JXB12_09655 [candidate division KSB1 bacterium]|nr:hypothetical protein [candidate division KSB1 bacterium]